MTDEQVETVSIYDIMPDLPRAYFTIDRPKHEIKKAIYDEYKSRELSVRKMADELKKLYQEDEDTKTPHFNTIQQIISGGNFTIDNLLMVLDLLNKKFVIVDRTEEDVNFINKKGKVDSDT